MAYPFRQPVSDNEEWKPPEYAVESKSSNDKWEPPDYAEPVSEEKPKGPSTYEKVKKAIKVGVEDTASDLKDTAASLKEKGSKFLEEHPKVASSAKRLAEGPKSDYPLVGQELSEFPGVRQAGEAIKNKAINTGSYWKGFLGSIAGDLVSGAATGVDPRTTGVKEENLIKEPPRGEEPPIRQSKEIPYRMGGSTQFGDVELPSQRAKVPAKEAVKDERPLPTRSPNLAQIPDEEIQRPKFSGESADDRLYRLARERFKMGLDAPEEGLSKPTATFKGMQETGIPGEQPMALFDVQGGKYDKSTVGIDRLKSEGIEVPEIPKDAEGLSGAELRSRAIAEKTGGAKPNFVNPFEKPSQESDLGTKLSPYGEGNVMPSGVRPSEMDLEEWKPPSYAEEVKKGDVKFSSQQEQPIIEANDLNKNPESLHPQLTALKNYGDGVLHMDFDKSQPMTEDSVKALLQKQGIDANVTEMYTNDKLPSRFRVDVQGEDPVHAEELGNTIEKSVGGSFDKSDNNITEMHGGLGGIKPSKRELEPNKGPYGAALDKLFNAMGSMSEKRVQQDIINRTERAKRFAAFSNVEDVGVKGAAQSLSALKGQFEKVDFERLKMTPPQVDSLFTAVKRANITPGEKARGYTALFKIMNGEGVPQRNELKLLDDVFGNNFADKITEMHGGIGAVGLKVSKLANTMKSMQNAISLAAPLRHGIGLVTRKEFGPAFRDMFKFFGDKEFYNYSMRAIEQRPEYMLGRESGLFLSKPSSLMNSEEEFLNSYVGDIPGVKHVVGASQRAYTGFLNKLRADTFDSMIKQAKGLGVETGTQVGESIIPSKETKAIANYINNATGRGSLGSLNKMTNELNLLLWSPRMIASRITMLTNPKIYMDLPKGMRLDGLKSLFGIAALGTTIDTLAAYGGAKVSTNILSTDYGKSRFGTNLIDPWGGFQQYIVGAARFLAGKTDNDKAYPPTSRIDIAGQFLKNKESPAASLAHDILTARKFTGGGDYKNQYGQDTSVQSEVSKRFMPIFVQDIEELAKSQPDWADNIGLNTALGAASLAGMSQQYPERKPKGLLGFRKLR